LLTFDLERRRHHLPAGPRARVDDLRALEHRRVEADGFVELIVEHDERRDGGHRVLSFVRTEDEPDRTKPTRSRYFFSRRERRRSMRVASGRSAVGPPGRGRRGPALHFAAAPPGAAGGPSPTEPPSLDAACSSEPRTVPVSANARATISLNGTTEVNTLST